MATNSPSQTPIPRVKGRAVTAYSYLIALGSNRCHPRYGAPARVIRAAFESLDIPISAISHTIQTAPVGPSLRCYANAAAVIQTAMPPPELLDHLKALEASFGRRRGQRWASRVLDLDIILWSGGIWSSPDLGIPHAAFRDRAFVLTPAGEIAADWRDPITGRTIRHLKARLDRKRPRP
jgi:2-amino-4-hydroxy-6-hydroxymethyldihydropteridine diphosphokinase